MIVYRELSSLCHDLGYSARTLYALSNTVERHYYEVGIPKKNGETRVLNVPDKLMKSVQRSIARQLLDYEPISKHAMAYRPGRSIVTNARYHVGREFVLKLDISKFFDHITYSMIKERVFDSERFSEKNRVLLSMLCTYKNVTPQGAPTSPVISNIILREFDSIIGEFCESRGILYTRYCDDMTFSGTFNSGEIISLVRTELRKMGFRLNDNKTVLLHTGKRITVTGLVVNQKLSVPKEYKKKIRQEMYFIDKYGIDDHLKKIGFSGNKEEYINSLIGRINYVRSIEKDNKEFEQLYQRLLF